MAIPTKQTESAPSFLQVYTQVRRDRMKHSFLRQISACVDWRGIAHYSTRSIQRSTTPQAIQSMMP